MLEKVFLLVLFLLFFGCGDSKKEKFLTKNQIEQINQFVNELDKAVKDYNYDLVENSWSHELFKRKVRNLDNTGRSVFRYIYDTRIKSLVNNRNSRLINEVRHSDAVLKYLGSNLIKDYAEAIFLLIEKESYSFTKYKIEFFEGKPYLTDIYSFEEDCWFSYAIYESVLLNVKYDASSKNRHQTNQLFAEYQSAVGKGDYYHAFQLLNDIPESHQMFNGYKLAKLSAAANISDSLLFTTINEIQNQKSNIYLDYWVGFYSNDSLFKNEINARMRSELGVSMSLLDSMNQARLIWK